MRGLVLSPPRSAVRLGRGLVGLLVVFVAAEAFTALEYVDADYLPRASRILSATAQLLQDMEFLGHVSATLLAWGLGVSAAAAVAVPVGVILGVSDRSYAASRALIELLRPVPSVALIPLALLLFGRSTSMKVSLIVYASVWPILFNTIYGIHDVDDVAKQTARAFGASRRRILLRVTIPSAAPFIYTGLRVAASIGLILAISAELLAGGERGIGTWMIVVVQTGGAREFIYAATVVAGLAGLGINALLVLVERRLFRWRAGANAHE